MKPKLLLVADTYYPKVDGTLRFMEEFLRRAHSDFSLSLLVPNLGKTPPSHFPITFIEPSPLLKISGYPSMKLSRSNFLSLRKSIQNADCVFVQGPGLVSYAAVLFAAKYKKPCVFYLHVIAWEAFPPFFPSFFRPLVRWFFRHFSVFCFNRCSRVLIPYNDLRFQAEKAGVRIPMSIAKLGIDIDRFRPYENKAAAKVKVGLDPSKFVIGYVGRISQEKNIHILLDAFKRLSDQHAVTLVLVGDGSKEHKEKLDLPLNCKVTGFVSNVESYLQAMDLFVMPSLTETTSLATLEAMSCGLPVIASKVGFMAHYIEKDHNGVFFSAANSAILAAKIEKLRRDPQKRKLLGENARRTIAYSYSWERSINRIKRLVLDVCYKQ
ncbi:glycosyltransferase [Candidatus Woesearchaeota archaeon]|nr:glycosyltransferase [Candidatus Woesearchaeota archaeon]